MQATLTTNKCGVAQPLIAPLSVLGAATKVTSTSDPSALDLKTTARQSFLWVDGFQTAFTDEMGAPNALLATGAGAGFGSTVAIPPSKAVTVVRFYLGVVGGEAQLSASLIDGGGGGAHYNATFTSGAGGAAKFGVAILQLPPSATAGSLRAQWAVVQQPGSSSSSSSSSTARSGSSSAAAVVSLGAISVESGGAPKATAAATLGGAAAAAGAPVRKCAAPAVDSSKRTLMLQAAALA